MAQGDYNVQNQGFPAFRSDLNSTLSAINSSNSGTSRPSSAVAGTVWLDVTNATNPTLKFFDGTDDISLAQLDYTANTVNWLDSTVTISPLTTDLDVGGNDIVSSSNGNITFTPDGTGKVIIDGLSHPTADGTSGQNLITDGAGNLSFSDVTPADNTVSLAKLTATGTKDATTFLRGDNTFAAPSGGKLLQVVQTAKTDTFSSASASWVDITGLSLSITPSATSSKVFITANFVTSHSAANSLGVRLMRDSTSIFAGDDTAIRKGATSWQYVGSNNQNVGSNSFQYVDSPSTTSATTYKLQIWSTGGTAYVGQMQVDSNNTTYGRSASSIIAMEIGA